MTTGKREQATCRGCGRLLIGDAYMYGGSAYLPEGGQAKVCYYGGFVCSESCDRRACLELERSMPGHDRRQTRLDGNLDADIMRKWES